MGKHWSKVVPCWYEFEPLFENFRKECKLNSIIYITFKTIVPITLPRHVYFHQIFMKLITKYIMGKNEKSYTSRIIFRRDITYKLKRSHVTRASSLPENISSIFELNFAQVKLFWEEPLRMTNIQWWNWKNIIFNSWSLKNFSFTVCNNN